MTKVNDRLSARPRMEMLEKREQPGNLLTQGLDASLLADALLGTSLVTLSRPAKVAQNVSTVKTVGDTALLPQSSSELAVVEAAQVEATKTSIGDIMGLVPPESKPMSTLGGQMRPGNDSGTRGPNLLFYGGDFDGINGLSNEIGAGGIDGRTYDEGRFRGAWSIDCAFSNNLMNVAGNVTSAFVTILGPGLAQNGQVNGGLPIAFQTNGPATKTQKPGGPYFGAYFEYTVEICGLGLTLPQGHYYLNVQPVWDNNPPGARSFLSTTSFANQKGSQTNGDAWFSSVFFGVVFGPAGNQTGGNPNFSHGLCSAPAC